MCGIAGVFGRGDAATVALMAAQLGHRGPDDDFLVARDGFALAARRLSIVDVEGGRQPLANEDERIWAAQNGELYNYRSVRRSLVSRGHTLHTGCDTEVLPHLYEEYGVDLPLHIDGMFAVALWDDASGRGLLARDRVGKKPLYYVEHDGCLYFGSEIKALLAIPGFERRIDLEALHHYLGYKHIPHPLSIFAGVRQVPPGCRLGYEPGGRPVIERYWAPSFVSRDAVDEQQAVEELEELLRKAVRRRLMGDVPVGFFLSGGIDSSLSTALAAEISSSPIKTFTLTYGSGSTTEGKERDRAWARYVATQYGTDHREATVDFGSFPDTIRPILRSFDEPFAGVVSTYFLSEVIGREVKVAVAGDGADELFGSYRSHRIAGGLEPPPEEAPDWQWRSRLLVLQDDEKYALYNPDVRAALSGCATAEHLRETAFADLTAADPLNRMLEAELRTFLPDQVLTFVDRLSMAHSLEVRSPYLDTEVVEYVAGLPGTLKIRDGETKYLLKRVAARRFPREMAFRPKEGFVMPVTDWLLRDLEPYVRETLAASAVGRSGIFDPGAIDGIVDGYYSEGGDYRYGNKILALVVFQEWFDLYMT